MVAGLALAVFRPDVATNKPVECTLKGIKFTIPAGYFRYSGSPVEGCHEDSNEIFLTAYLPNILEEPGERIAAMNQRERLKYEVGIVVNVPYTGKPKEEIYQDYKNQGVLKPAIAGLESEKIKNFNLEAFYGKTAYQHIIVCDTGENPYPTCRGGVEPLGKFIQYNYRFPRDRLSEWRSIGLDSEKFIQKITILPTEGMTP
jgi:hypothetical protein